MNLQVVDGIIAVDPSEFEQELDFPKGPDRERDRLDSRAVREDLGFAVSDEKGHAESERAEDVSERHDSSGTTVGRGKRMALFAQDDVEAFAHGFKPWEPAVDP